MEKLVRNIKEISQVIVNSVAFHGLDKLDVCDYSFLCLHHTLTPGAVMEEETLFFGLFAEDDEVASVFPDYQPVFVDEFVPSQEQVQVCGGHHLCAYDYAQTGKKEVGLMTKTIQNRNAENEALLGMKVLPVIRMPF